MQDSLSFQKIQSFLNDSSIEQTVLETLRSQKINTPTLRVTGSPAQSTSELSKLFSYFGGITSAKPLGESTLITYTRLVSAYFAQKVLNKKEIPELNIVLSVDWHKEDQRRVPFTEIQNTSSAKLTARFDIMIENDDEFHTARRIIGAKGGNMKSIVEKCCKGFNAPAHDVVKLRVRGRGSGFKEGPEKVESSERLHICISSKYADRLQLASLEVEKLLDSVYVEYDRYRRAKGLSPFCYKTQFS